MKLELDQEAQNALDIAKRSVPEGESIEIAPVLAALCHSASLKQRFPWLTDTIPELQPVTQEPGRRRVGRALRTALEQVDDSVAATPTALLAGVLATRAGRETLLGFGVATDDVDRLVAALEEERSEVAGATPGWRETPERAEVVKALSAYGRVLTATELPDRRLYGVEDTLRRVMQALVQRKMHSVVVVGPPGTGKTAIVHDLARRVSVGDPLIVERLRDIDIFELSPAFLRAGASVVGQFEERVKALLEIVRAHPQVVVFVDEVHALLQSEMHGKSPWSGGSAEFKKAVGSGELALIGCTTLAEYRHYIEPDRALADRLTEVRVKPPTATETIEIMRHRLPGVRAYYDGLSIPDEVIPLSVKLAEKHLLGQYQPRKSIQLLDEACAWCLVQDPPLQEVSDAALRLAIEARTGHRLVEPGDVTKDHLYRTLTAKIVGQDELIEELVTAVVLGMSSWSESRSGPRGNFFFAGPTGVGKTQTAKLLARAITGGPEGLIRVDSNTLQGSGWDSRSAINALLGAPPGFVGYSRGQGGLLSKVRDTPECVVLFDEIEKADPGVGKLLLQILDEGVVDDAEGRPLDFRRAFLVFTSNAGVTYTDHSPYLGFQSAKAEGDPQVARVSPERVMEDLRQRGFPEEFLGRKLQWFTFRPLDEREIREVLRRKLEALRAHASQREPPLAVEWDPAAFDQLVAGWDPRFGVRHLITLLRNRVVGQLSLAEALGEIDGITRIHLTVGPEATRPGATTRRREGETLIIELS